MQQASPQALDWMALELLQLLIGVALFVPIPVVAAGIAGGVGVELLAVAAFVTWTLAVPISAATLTLRYLRLQRHNDVPTRLAHALVPVLGAIAIGLVALGASLGAAGASPVFARSAPLGVTPRSEGQPVVFSTPVEGTDLEVGRYRDDLTVTGPTHVRHVSIPPAWTWCAAHPRSDRSVAVHCMGERTEGWVEIDASGAPLEATLGERVSTRIGSFTIATFVLALLTLALALAWLGRVGVSLRLLARPPFTLSGALRSADEGADGALTFASDAHRVRVPASRVLAPLGWAASDGEPAVLLSHAHLEPMAFRTAHAACPSDALLVIGSREAALGHAIARARSIGFRLGVIALAALVAASAGVLLSL